MGIRLLTILLMLIAAPALVLADSNIPETKSEPEVALSTPAIVPLPTTPAATSKMEKKKNKKKMKRVSKAKKVNFEDSTTNAIRMSEEEQQLMQTRNKTDGYRATKRKSNKEQTVKK